MRLSRSSLIIMAGTAGSFVAAGTLWTLNALNYIDFHQWAQLTEVAHRSGFF